MLLCHACLILIGSLLRDRGKEMAGSCSRGEGIFWVRARCLIFEVCLDLIFMYVLDD